MRGAGTDAPEAAWEEPTRAPYGTDSGSYGVTAVPMPTAMPDEWDDAMAEPTPMPMPDSEDSVQESSSSYPVGATAMPEPTTSAWVSDSESGSAAVSTAVPSATTFQDYRRSPLVAASRDRTSTFSLDTDRTSFQLALNWVRNGYQVDPDSVRAEEWVNAFHYGYEKPRRQDSFAISTALVEHPLQSEMHLARITFQAPDVRDDKRPLNVTLVLDASGSMADGNRVGIARAAADAIRRSLGRNDRISVVQFSTDVLHEYTVEGRGPGDGAVANSIANLRPNNSTNVQAGLNLGSESPTGCAMTGQTRTTTSS